jgi:hypothetical protein
VKTLKNLQINIFTSDLEWVGQIDSVKSLVHRTSWHEIANSELTVSKRVQGIEELKIGRILVVNNQKDKALIIEDLSASLSDEYVNFNCVSLKAILNYRICHPADSGSFSQQKQSDIMLELVSRNLVTQTRDNDRKFLNSLKNKNMLSVSSPKGFGNTIDFTVDWETGPLGDTMTTVSKNSTIPLGWNVIIKDNYESFEMNVYQSTERHINQTNYPPVIFSEEFGNVKDSTYEYSIKQWKNLMYLTWSTEEDKDTVNVLEIENENKGEVSSFNRREDIYDSSKTTSNEVKSEGRSEINKRPHVENFSSEIINNNNTLSTYREHWDLGDVVTVQSKEVLKNKLISLDVQITELEETYDSGEYSINVTFGLGQLTFTDLIKQQIKQRK